jgi:competence protein ComEC
MPVTLAFAAGIAAVAAGLNIIICTLPLLAAIALALSGRRYLCAIAAAVTLGAADMWLNTPDSDTLSALQGTLYAECDIAAIHESETTRSLTVNLIQTGSDTSHLESCPPLKARIYIPSTLPPLSPGDRILLRCSFSSRPFIEYVPGQLNTTAVLARQGINAQAVAKPEDILRAHPSPALMMRFTALRQRISTLILRSGLEGHTKEFLVTTITGSSEYLDPDVRSGFAAAGIAHILALSGLHVGILMAFCSLLLMPMMLSGRLRRAMPLCMIALLWIFAATTGLSPSVTRAVIMATVLLSASMLQRRHSSWNSLCLAALLILIINPAALLSVSFQLSFAAVGGILAFGNTLNPVPRRHTRIYAFSSLLAMSTGAMLATALVSTFYFHRLPLWFLLANILSVPVLTPLVGGGMLLVLLESIGIHASWLCSLLDLLYRCLTGIADLCNRLPGTADGIIVHPLTLVTGSAAVVFIAIFLNNRKKVFAASAAICAATAAVFAVVAPEDPKHGVYISPSTYSTEIIVSTPQCLRIISTAPASEHPKLLSTAKILYSDFMLRRGIDSIAVNTGDISTGYVLYTAPLLSAGSKTLLIADSKKIHTRSNIKVDYLLICRGYTGTVADALQSVNAGQVILSADLHPARHKKYADECAAAGIAWLSLKNQAAGNLLSAD